MKSWEESANGGGDFPLANLPYGVFRRGGLGRPRIAVAIGDQVLDLRACLEAGLIDVRVCGSESLNELMSLGKAAWRPLRARLTELLRWGASERSLVSTCLVPRAEASMEVPATIGDYTDFYASIHHATRVGALLRPDQPLFPNYRHVPIAYHGRASSIVVSGTPVRRPNGQMRGAEGPDFGPTRALDYELELGCFVGPGNALGEPIPIADAESHIFGFCLLNDWSARDIQAWEYQPLGPFLGKNFLTTISPWVVTLEALDPYRVAGERRDVLPYLETGAAAAFDITLEVWLRTPSMREAIRISSGNFRDMYWTVSQMLAHHASNGCNLRPADLLGSGTVSGADPGSRGCLLEMTARGAEPLHLPTGETRAFLEDGDEVELRGWCEREGMPRIGFGSCRGVVTAAYPG